jgi:hypothetical protein
MTYLWTGNTTGATLPVSASGTYSVTATAANGCTSITSVVISQSIGAPTVGLIASGTLTCAQTVVTLTASGGGTYAFAGTGVVASSGSSATVNQADTFSVVVTGANGCTAFATTTVLSNTTTPTLIVTPGSGTLSCSITSLTLTASGTGTNYRWTGGTAGTTLTVSTSGTYSVTATAANGCTSTTSVVVSQSADLPTVGLVASGTLTCSNTAVTLTASGGNSYAFSGSGVVASSGSSATVNVGGLYSVTVTNTATGCSSVTTTTVQSNTTAPTAGLVHSGTLTCARTALTLTASGGGTYAFTGTGIVASAGSSATVNQAGTFSVVVTGSNGCTALATSTVSSNTTAPTPGIVASGSLSCGNPTVTLTGSGGNAYLFGGAGIASQSGNQAIVNQAGPYSLTVTNTATGCFSTTSITVTGSLAGVAPSSMLPASASTVCEGSTVQVAAVVSGTITGYQWYRNGQPVSGQASATLSLGNVQAAQAGSYELFVTGGCGSAMSTGFSLIVNALPVVTLSLLNNGAVLQATGGVLYERLIVVDRIGSYEIRQTDSSSHGFFNITRSGPFRLTVTGSNGCRTVVDSNTASIAR